MQRAMQAAKWAVRAGMAATAVIGALDLFYSTMQPGKLRLLVVAAFLIVVGFAATRKRLWLGATLWSIATAALIIWHVHDRPLNDRDWAAEYAIPATADREGYSMDVKHIRNFTWNSEVDFSPSYYDASFPLDELATVDLVTSYWSSNAIAHVFLTFGFQDGRHLAVSIETRRQIDTGYSAVAGFFHHYELFYVVADERDLIGVRTDIRHERVYLYRLNTTMQQRQTLFRSYMNKVQRLEQHPEWYNSLTDNCTTGIVARSDSLIDVPYDWRVLFSGYAADYAYSLGALDTSRSFADLREQSLIKRPPGARIDRGYSQEIRRGLPLKDVKTAS